MRKRQPDNRIRPENLDMMVLKGKRFVINLRLGVPFNACIEDLDSVLRCWASKDWLDERAALVVDSFATKTQRGSYLWNENVKRGPFVCIKGGYDLFRVVFP